MSADVWDHFGQNRSLYGRDGLHVNSVGKARLARVLGEGVRKELKEHKAHLEKHRSEVQGVSLPNWEGPVPRGRSK